METFLEDLKIAQSLVENDSVSALRKNLSNEERARIFR